jgi:hypothetical protein
MSGQYAVYDPINDDFNYYDTIEEARQGAKEYIASWSDELWPTDYVGGGLMILKILEASHWRPTEFKEDYPEGEWPYGRYTNEDVVGVIEMTPVEVRE